jgi:hypothetical protein
MCLFNRFWTDKIVGMVFWIKLLLILHTDEKTPFSSGLVFLMAEPRLLVARCFFGCSQECSERATAFAYLRASELGMGNE